MFKNTSKEKLETDKKKELEILDFGIIKVSKQSLNFKIETQINSNAIRMDFDYLDCNDGVLYEVQHTGDHNTIAELAGVILGPKRKTKVVASVLPQK